MDSISSKLASRAGLDAVGILLMLLDVSFAALMVILISKAGAGQLCLGLMSVVLKVRSAWHFCEAKLLCCMRNRKATAHQAMSDAMQSNSGGLASRANSGAALMQPAWSNSSSQLG